MKTTKNTSQFIFQEKIMMQMLGMGNMKTSMNDVLNIIMKKANVKSSAAAKEDKM